MTTRSHAAPILAALTIVLVPLGGYVGGYYSQARLATWRDPK